MNLTEAINAVEHAAESQDNLRRKERMHSWVAAMAQLLRDHGEMQVVFPEVWTFEHHPQLAPGEGGTIVVNWGPMPGTPKRMSQPGDSATQAEIDAQNEAKKDPKRFQRDTD